MKISLCLICFLGLFSKCYAQVIIDNDFERISLKNKLLILNDSSGKLNIADIVSQKNKLQFSIHDESAPNLIYDTGTRWVRFDIKNNTKKSQKIFLRVNYSRFDSVWFYSVQSGKIISKAKYINGVNISTAAFKHVFPIYTFITEPSESTTIYSQYFKKRQIWKLPKELMAEPYFLVSENENKLLYTGIIGSVIIIVLVSMYLFILDKNIIYLYFAVYTISLLLILFATLDISPLSTNLSIALATAFTAPKRRKSSIKNSEPLFAFFIFVNI